MRLLASIACWIALVTVTLVLHDIWQNEERYLFWSHCLMIAATVLLAMPALVKTWIADD